MLASLTDARETALKMNGDNVAGQRNKLASTLANASLTLLHNQNALFQPDLQKSANEAQVDSQINK